MLFLARISLYQTSSNEGMGDNLMERVGRSFMQKKEWPELPEVLGGATHIPTEHSLPFEIAGIWKKAITCLAPSSPQFCGCSHKVSKFGLV